MSDSHPTAVAQPASTDAERIARGERADALARGHAVLVGTRAGVVEWTDAAWTRLTGFPLVETVQKPITHFLERAGLERELVEFVAHHFLEGRPCTVALPFDTFDGRHVDVTLEVEPWRDARGEITRFVAVAREAEVVSSGSTRPPGRDDRPGPAAVGSLSCRTVPLETLLDESIVNARRARTALRDVDVHLATEATVVVPSDAPEVIACVLEAAADATREHAAWISLVGGALRAGRSHHSLVHPVPSRAVISQPAASCYLEIHDAGPHLDRDALARLRERADAVDSSPRERALLRALRLADAADLTLLLDSTPGCGTQALLVLARA